MEFKNIYPPDNEFEGKIALYLERGLEEFRKLFKYKFDLNNYVIGSKDFSKEEGYYGIYFIPKPVSMFEDIVFEIPDRAMYKNGIGVEFYFSSEDNSLLKTIYMR